MSAYRSSKSRSRRRSRRGRPITALDTSETLRELWLLRLVVHFLKRQMTHHAHAFDDDAAAMLSCLLEAHNPPDALDINEFDLDDPPTLYRRSLRRLRELEDPENPDAPLRLPQPLDDNLAWLASHMNLNPVERDVLALAILINGDAAFMAISAEIERSQVFPYNQLYRLLSRLLGYDEARIRAAMHRKGLLVRSGMLDLDDSPYSLHDVVDDMDAGFVNVFMLEEDNIEAALGDQLFRKPKAATLESAMFSHLAMSPETVAGYLANAAKAGRAGVNVLIHGIPGTGKTEFMRLVAEQSGLMPMEVPNSNADGEARSPDERLRGYRLIQSMFGHKHEGLVLFDEVEDLFPSMPHPLFALFGESRRRGDSKSWMNELLEENPLPAIWICNDPAGFDPAFLRRFDIVFEMPVPPRRERLRILRDSLEDVPVSPQWIERVAGCEQLSPAMVTRAAEVVKALGVQETDAVEQRLQQLMNGWLRASGQTGLPARRETLLRYRPDLINTDPSVERLAEALARSGYGRLYFYGPPGTGKTAFAHYLAERLNRTLMVRRASDILSPWVGETEQSIARIFREAERDDAVLLIDEADTLLRSRENAHHSWEVSRVNEMLTRMEAFEGIFIVSTNFDEVVDEASMRRFDIRVRFAPLNTDQAWGLFRQALEDAGQPVDVLWRDELARLENLTPGDFQTVLRHIDIAGFDRTARRLLRGLEQEARERTKRSEAAVLQAVSG